MENKEKAYCNFTLESSMFCSHLPDCKLCDYQPKEDEEDVNRD